MVSSVIDALYKRSLCVGDLGLTRDTRFVMVRNTFGTSDSELGWEILIATLPVLILTYALIVLRCFFFVKCCVFQDFV
jgi:hypothetical protein